MGEEELLVEVVFILLDEDIFCRAIVAQAGRPVGERSAGVKVVDFDVTVEDEDDDEDEEEDEEEEEFCDG